MCVVYQNKREKMLKHNSWQPNRSLSQADSISYEAALAAVCKEKLFVLTDIWERPLRTLACFVHLHTY